MAKTHIGLISVLFLNSGCRDSVFSVVTIWGSNPSSCELLISSQKLPDRLWGPTSPIFSASRETFPGGRVAGAEFHPLPKLRNSGCISPFPLYVFMPCIRTTLAIFQTLIFISYVPVMMESSVPFIPFWTC
jgi:hypothetical protein